MGGTELRSYYRIAGSTYKSTDALDVNHVGSVNNGTYAVGGGAAKPPQDPHFLVVFAGKAGKYHEKE